MQGVFISEEKAASHRCKAYFCEILNGGEAEEAMRRYLLPVFNQGQSYSLLFVGEHCYEDGQSLCFPSETIV